MDFELLIYPVWEYLLMVEPENGLSLIHENELTKVVTNNPTNENRGKFMNIIFRENNFI